MTSPRPPHITCPLISVRQPLQASPAMGRFTCERVGNSGDQVGVPPSMAVRQSSPYPLHSPLQTSSQPHGLQELGRRDPEPPPQRSHSGDHPSNIPGVLWKDLCGAQVFRRLEAHTGPLPTQPLPRREAIQDGNSLLHQRLHPSWRLGHIHRPQRCVLSHPGPPQRQKVAEVRLEGQNLPVQSPPLRPSPRSLGIHQDNQGAMHFRPEFRHPPSSIPRRLAEPGLVQRTVPIPYQSTPGPLPSTGFLLEPREVGSHPLPVLHLPGNEIRHSRLAGFPLPTADRPPPQPVAVPLQPAIYISETTGLATRSNGIPLPSCAPRPPPQEGVPATIQGQMVSEIPVLGHDHTPGRLVSPNDSQMVRQTVANSGSPHHSPSSARGPLHRRLKHRLGRPRRDSHRIRPLARRHARLAHKHARARSSRTSVTQLLARSLRKICESVHRQYNSGLLPQQTGRGPVPPSLPQDRRAPSLVPGPEHHPFGQTRSGENQHTGRLPQQSPQGDPHGVDPCALLSGTNLESLALSPRRPVRDAVQQPPTYLRLSSSRPQCMGSRCILHSLDKHPGLRLSPNPNNGKSSTKSKRGPRQLDPHSPSLASPTVVPGSSPPIPHTSSQASNRSPITTSTEVRHPTRKPRDARPPRLAAVRQSLSALGVSPQVADLISKSHRPGTQAAYASHWATWLEWCNRNTINSLDPSAVDLANFLGFLITEKGLSPSSVSAHRSAVSSTIRQMGGPSLSDCPLLRDIIRGASLSNPRSAKRAPAWDLFLVLASLRGPPYEPIHTSSLKHLTWKTTFLVSLASGRRCSEVHALSGLPNDVSREPHGAISLRFLPDFLAKNQSPNSPSPSILIKPLSSILAHDDPDRTLCPVRALRAYRERTKGMRLGRRRLLLSWNERYHKDITKNTISRWIREVISSAYKNLPADQRCVKARAHEVRAWASSMAFSFTKSLKEVLDAAYWKSEDTFINFYLRDISRLNEENVGGISSVVVAQHSITVPRSLPSRR